MDEIMQILDGPVKVWHLPVLWAFLMIGLYQLQWWLIRTINKHLYELWGCTAEGRPYTAAAPLTSVMNSRRSRLTAGASGFLL
jgi:hypothetical protein